MKFKLIFAFFGNDKAIYANMFANGNGDIMYKVKKLCDNGHGVDCDGSLCGL